jgi:hypothetical protein
MFDDSVVAETMEPIFKRAVKVATENDLCVVLDCILAAGKSWVSSFRIAEILGKGLTIAIVTNSVELVNIFISHGVALDDELKFPRISGRNFRGSKHSAFRDGYIVSLATPVEMAFVLGNMDVLAALVRKGASTSIRSETLWEVSMIYSYVRLPRDDDPSTRRNLRILRQHQFSTMTYKHWLIMAIKSASIPYAKFCIEQSSNSALYRLKRNGRKSPLWHAVTSGNLEIVKLLFQHGAELQGNEVFEIRANKKKIEESFGMTWEEIMEADSPDLTSGHS